MQRIYRLLLVALLPSVACAVESAFVVPRGERQLFLDDVDVAGMQSLVRTMHRPAKKGAVVQPDLAWETALQTRSTPAWDAEESVFKLWMITSTNVPGAGGTSYAISKDGRQWTKPVLRQWEFQGSRENNFVALEPTMQWPENAIENVVYDRSEPDAARRYKGLLGAFDRRPMVSPDGIHWKLLDVPAIPSQDESNLSLDTKERLFILTVKHGGPYGRSVRLSTSKDFEHWTKPVLVFHADELDQELGRQHIRARRKDLKLQMQRPLWDIRDSYKGHTAEPKVDVYNMGLFRYESLYIGTPAMFHSNDNRWNKDGFHLIQLVCTRNLKTFKRLGNREAFIGPSPLGEGHYDLTQLIGPSAPVIRGDELWFYYTGIKYRTPPKNADEKAGAVCLAVLRRDGFISLDAAETEGWVQTRPFTVPRGRLHVNANVMDGELKVECLNAEGAVVATSRPLTGDLLRAPVEWGKGTRVGGEGETVRLRFRLTNGSLYSYWFDR